MEKEARDKIKQKMANAMHGINLDDSMMVCLELTACAISQFRDKKTEAAKLAARVILQTFGMEWTGLRPYVNDEDKQKFPPTTGEA